MPPYVPPEIIDIILGHADDELLCTCALVCHVWLETSRRHLFQRIALVRATAYDSFIRQIVHCRRMAPWLKLARILFYSEESANQNRGNRIFLELAGQLPNLSSLRVLLPLNSWTLFTKLSRTKLPIFAIVRHH